jgi:hypothetical protein
MARSLKRAEPAKARTAGEHMVAARAVVRLSHARHRPNDMDWFGRLGESDDEFPDDFFADLRDALDDPKPLGPRDEPVTLREPVSHELFRPLPPPPASPPAGEGGGEGGVERGVERGVEPAGRRAHAKGSPWRQRVVGASRWIRNASAVVLAADLVTVARHLL